MTNHLAYLSGITLAALELGNAEGFIQMLGTLSGTGLLVWIVIHKDKEATQLRKENRELTRELSNKCKNCTLTKAANDLLTDSHHDKNNKENSETP